MNENINQPEGMNQPGMETGQYSGTQPSTTERAKESMRQSKEQIKAKAGEWKAKAADVGAQAKEKGGAYAEEKKSEAAGRIESYGDTVREASDRMERENDPNIAHYTRMVADKLEQAAEYVRRSDFNDLRRDAETVARRNPTVFFGGMFLAGLVVARFLKASAQHEHGYEDEEYMSGSMTGTETGWEPEPTEPVYPSHPTPVI